MIQQRLTGNNNVAELVFSILQPKTASVVYDRACMVLTEWQSAQAEHKERNNRQQQPAEVSWTKPSPGRYKCNIDASFSPGLNRVGLGTCIRDDQGSFVLAKTEWFSPICEVDMGEAQGLLRAFKWVRDLQLDNVDFELDAKTVVMKVLSKNDDISELGEVIKDCQQLHNTFLRNSKVEFIRRQINVAAHVLARVAPSLASFRIFTDTPTCIHNIIINETL
ncbi:cytochrome P450 [Trifolium medium]|uniref:Cytochrome P450 n=1 Tax=Trifolium medium TaxID=97028 RepID=A0A392M2A9_9FABA|nr:cytochrome P450 [Trifolium medium]